MQRGGPGGVPAEQAGWWERRLDSVKSNPATPSPIAGGRPRVPVTFFAPPKKVTKERGIPGSPPLPRNLVRCPCAARPARRSAQLAHRSRYSKHFRREITAETHGYARLAQCSPETPGWSALLGGEQGPQQRNRSIELQAVTHVFELKRATAAAMRAAYAAEIGLRNAPLSAETAPLRHSYFSGSMRCGGPTPINRPNLTDRLARERIKVLAEAFHCFARQAVRADHSVFLVHNNLIRATPQQSIYQ